MWPKIILLCKRIIFTQSIVIVNKGCKPHFLMQIYYIFFLEGHYFLDIQYIDHKHVVWRRVRHEIWVIDPVCPIYYLSSSHPTQTHPSHPFIHAFSFILVNFIYKKRWIKKLILCRQRYWPTLYVLAKMYSILYCTKKTRYFVWAWSLWSNYKVQYKKCAFSLIHLNIHVINIK